MGRRAQCAAHASRSSRSPADLPTGAVRGDARSTTSSLPSRSTRPAGRTSCCSTTPRRRPTRAESRACGRPCPMRARSSTPHSAAVEEVHRVPRGAAERGGREPRGRTRRRPTRSRSTGSALTMSPEEAAQRGSDGRGARRLSGRDLPPRRRAVDRLPRPRRVPSGVWDAARRSGCRRQPASWSVSSTPASRPRTRHSPARRLRAARGRRRRTSSATEVVFEKADGREFRSTSRDRAEVDQADYSTKLIGAQYFAHGRDERRTSTSTTTCSRLATATATAPTPRASRPATTAWTRRSRASTSAPSRASRPAAKIAAYKACFVGADPLVTADDICVGSDLLAAVEQAVADGVDVINYSVGGGAAAPAGRADDISFYNAAVAGVFIAVSAGNTGPGASTVGQRGAPWYTTVAASTVPALRGHRPSVDRVRGRRRLGVGAVRRARHGARSSTRGTRGWPEPADAHLCYLGTLDPVQGRRQDRRLRSRHEPAHREVAGGGGRRRRRDDPGERRRRTPLDSDFHSVPTVHIDSADRAALLAELCGHRPGATATLIGENVTGVEIPTPQIAGFSSRGPSLDRRRRRPDAGCRGSRRRDPGGPAGHVQRAADLGHRVGHLDGGTARGGARRPLPRGALRLRRPTRSSPRS